MTEKTETGNTQPAPAAAEDDAAPAAAKIKREKIDIEIEAKLRALNAKIKSESSGSPPTNETATESDESNNSNESSPDDDKKQIVPVKSSNEILAELFSVFNAAPPQVLLDDKNLLKKHRKSKKDGKESKEKKRSRSKLAKSEGECSDSDRAAAKGKHYHKNKRRKHKHKHKDSKDKHKDKDREKAGEEKAEEKTSRKRHSPLDLAQPSIVLAKKERLQREQSADRERERDRERDRDRERERERANNSFYNGYQEATRGSNSSRPSKMKTERRQSDELSLSDEETYLREKANGRRRFYGGDAGTGTGTRARTKQESSSNSNGRRHNRTSNSFRQRTRSRSRSRSRDLGIDKKRLLEIARRNAITMFKRGNMAGVAEMTPEVKDKVLLKMRYGGRTVQDLTDFCKKISNGELLSELSSDEDSDVDKNGNAKAFHHPFQLKEREPIVMHIRNSTPIVPATRREDQTKAITMQFPVSSGQVHRMSEVWVRVEPKEPLAPLPALPAAKQATNMFKDVQRNVFAKTIPQQEQQEPAFKPSSMHLDAVSTTETNGTATGTATGAVAVALPTPVPVPVPASVPLPVPTPVPAPAPVTKPPPPPPVKPPPPLLATSFVPEVPIPSTAPHPPPPSASIFPQTMPPSMDVSSIITQRLSAIRRLQDNPADCEAIKMMYNAQKDMSSWASSKFIPGQFTGSTGAQVMKVHELNSGPQLWARRDQLTCNKPVTGGMGMALLQKMGWKPGEGLGRTKTGSLQPLQLTVKLDKRGLISSEDIKQPPARSTGGTRVNKNTNAANIAQAALTAQDKHPVCVLNELTSKNRWTPPQYMLKEDKGPSHSRMFLFSVEINGQTYTPSESCNNKKEAKLNAAKLCLRALGILPHS